jgi:hypothetical protein
MERLDSRSVRGNNLTNSYVAHNSGNKKGNSSHAQLELHQQPKALSMSSLKKLGLSLSLHSAGI